MNQSTDRSLSAWLGSPPYALLYFETVALNDSAKSAILCLLDNLIPDSLEQVGDDGSFGENAILLLAHADEMQSRNLARLLRRLLRLYPQGVTYEKDARGTPIGVAFSEDLAHEFGDLLAHAKQAFAQARSNGQDFIEFERLSSPDIRR